MRREFLFCQDAVVTYQEFNNLVAAVRRKIQNRAAFTVLSGVHSLYNYAHIIALVDERKPFHVCAPIRFSDPTYRTSLSAVVGMDCLFGETLVAATSGGLDHPIQRLVLSGGAPCVVKTSGSMSVHHKFVLHDLHRFVKKYKTIGTHFEKTLAFSPLDSIAGMETLLEAVTHKAGLALYSDKISPQSIIEALVRHRVDYFQTTPSFMNLLSSHLKDVSWHLKDLKKIAFGSEPSNPGTLELYLQKLPTVELMHTYGMTEIGILKTKTDPQKPWRFRLDGTLNPYRVIEEKLEVFSPCLMVGYLNAPGGGDADGWFKTGDVIQDVDDQGYLRVVGRQDGTINVGGRKFFPTELEDILVRMDSIQDVLVYAKSSPIVGNIVCADVVLKDNKSEAEFRSQFKGFSETHLPAFMSPSVIKIIERDLFSERLKKIRPHP